MELTASGGRTHGVGVAAELHLPQLEPGPVRVQLDGADERHVHAQTSAGYRRTQILVRYLEIEAETLR